MSMAARQAPIRKLLQPFRCRMPFGWSCLKRKRCGVVIPTGPPINDLMIGKVMRSFLLLDRNRLDCAVVPNKGPILFRIYLAFRLEPVCNTLRFAVVVTRSEVIQDVVVGAEVSIDPLAFVVVAFSR